MESWPSLQVICTRAVLEEFTDRLSGLLHEQTGTRRFLGLRESPEMEAPGDAAGLTLTFADREARDRAARVIATLTGTMGQAVRRMSAVDEPDRDWVREVAATVVAVPLGRRFAALPGDMPCPAERIGIRVVRSRAFGTGEHATTRLAAELLEDAARRGGRVLDLGTGTGILAALAVQAGAKEAVAIDSDPTACRIARQTMRVNRLDRVRVLCGTLGALAPDSFFRCVVANLELDTLLAVLAGLAGRVETGGRVILSGILDSQVVDLLAAAREEGLVEVERRASRGWTAVALAPRPGVIPCVQVPPGSVTGGRVLLPPGEAHHLVRVRRHRPGQTVMVTDGRGGAWTGHLGETGGPAVEVDGLSPRWVRTRSALSIVLLQGVLDSASPMKTLIRMVTELGVRRIVPVLSARTQKSARLAGREVPPAWRRVAMEAVKQCGRTHVPALDPMTPLAELLALPFDGVSMVLDPDGSGWDAGGLPAAPRQVRLLVGPEGGLTPGEMHAVRQAGFVPRRLGPRVLRAETAAAAGVSLLQAMWGDLRHDPGLA